MRNTVNKTNKEIEDRKKKNSANKSSKEVQKRLAALEKIVGSANGLFTNLSIQSIKASRDI
jgi:hypothetical protein